MDLQWKFYASQIFINPQKYYKVSVFLSSEKVYFESQTQFAERIHEILHMPTFSIVTKLKIFRLQMKKSQNAEND